LYSGDPAGAEQAFEAARRCPGDWPESDLRQGQVLAAIGRRDAARRAYERSLARHPEVSGARDSLARLGARLPPARSRASAPSGGDAVRGPPAISHSRWPVQIRFSLRGARLLPSLATALLWSAPSNIAGGAPLSREGKHPRRPTTASLAPHPRRSPWEGL